jgi:hypothetical protein
MMPAAAGSDSAGSLMTHELPEDDTVFCDQENVEYPTVFVETPVVQPAFAVGVVVPLCITTHASANPFPASAGAAIVIGNALFAVVLTLYAVIDPVELDISYNRTDWYCAALQPNV